MATLMTGDIARQEIEFVVRKQGRVGLLNLFTSHPGPVMKHAIQDNLMNTSHLIIGWNGLFVLVHQHLEGSYSIEILLDESIIVFDLSNREEEEDLFAVIGNLDYNLAAGILAKAINCIDKGLGIEASNGDRFYSFQSKLSDWLQGHKQRLVDASLLPSIPSD